MRINQLAKDLGVSNNELIEAAEKRLHLPGKSHSSNLTEDQVSQLRRVFEAKQKGVSEVAPLGLHKAAASVKVVKSRGEAAPEAPKAEPAKPAPPVLVKRVEPKPEAPPAEAPATVAASAPAPASAPAQASDEAPARPEAAGPQEGFSRLKISATPAPATKADEKPARYIQLPQAPVKREGPKPEAGARPVLQRPGQNPSNVQRSGMPQQEKAVLQMASNTAKGEVKHELPPQPVGKRPYIPPSINQLRPEGGFSKISISDTPSPAPRAQEPARYIQLPQARPMGGARPTGAPGSRPSGPGSRPSGPGSRPSGPGGPSRGPGGPRPGGPGGRPGFGPRPGGPGGRPGMGGPPAGPIDPNATKGPGRTAHVGGKKKKGYTKVQQEMDLKLRQPRSRSQQIATEYIEEEVGIVMLSEGVSVKELAEKTQFLVVTHNRRSIEVADAIYGVSMGPDGVSKVLSLRIADLPQN